MRALFVLIVLISTNTFSQSVLLPLRVNNLYGADKITMNIYHPMHMYGSGSTVSQRYILKVVLKDGSTVQCRSRIDFSKRRHAIIVRKSRTQVKLKPAETRAVIRMPDVSQDDVIEGIATDSCWLFKTRHAKLNCYSYLPEGETFYLAAVQTGEGKIVNVSKENLISLMRNPDERTVHLIEKGRLIEAVRRYNEGY